MKTKKPIFRLVALAALSFFTGNEVVAQTSIGQACGCPAFSGRNVVSITSEGSWTTLPTAAYGKELLGSQNIVLTCDKTWTLDEKLYIGPGSTITIQPGTVIKGNVASMPAAATALIIERGGKIIAPGTEECPIIFTALADGLTGQYGVTNEGAWGGVLLCGRATNNLTLAANGPFVPGGSGKLAAADGLGVLEGFASSMPQDQFGVAIASAPSNYTLATSPPAVANAFDYTFNGTSAPGVSGSNATGQNKITLTASNVAIVAGQFVSGTGIPTNTQVTSVAGATLTLSAVLTANLPASETVTFSGDYPNASTQAYYLNYGTSSLPTVMGPLASVGSTVVNYAAPSISAFGETFNDNDNSGIMTYVSIRHSGAILSVGAEINGLTLASVGRGTKIEHIEIVSCADDNIEIFGGTVNLKYCTTLFGNDDMYDFDLGWTGKAQFLFGMKANQFTTANGAPGSTLSGISPDNDHGFEMDSDDSQSYNLPRSTPVIYNATIIGNDKIALTSGGDNTSLSAICAKENAGGSIYNSLFANFRNGFNMKKGLGSNTKYFKGGESWHNWVATGSNSFGTATGVAAPTGATTLTLSTTPTVTLANGMAVSGVGIAEGTIISNLQGSGSSQSMTLTPASTGALTATNYTFSVCSPTVGNGSQILKVKCNTFVTNPISGANVYSATTGTVAAGSVLPGDNFTTGTEMYQFLTTDKNIEATSLAGFSSAFQITSSPNTNTVGTKNDVVPSPGINVQLGTGCAQAPMDGFFEPANYRGAFAPSLNNENWLSDWSYSQVINSSKGVQACPTDLDSDGDTDVDDFGIFAPAFGTSCN